MSDYTIGEIAAAHGEKVRTVQFWADSGALQPKEGTGRKGKGTQRRFSETEMRLAGLAKRLAAMNSPIGEISDVLSRIRSASPSHALEETLRINSDMKEYARQAESNPKSWDRYKVMNAYLHVLGLLLIGGAGRGNIDLIISYYFDDGEINSRIMFMHPNDVPVDRAAGVGLRGFIGFKHIRLNAERDIWIEQKPDLETSEQLAEMFTIVSRTIKGLAAKWAEKR